MTLRKSNRIVVDYNGLESLICIGIVDHAGKEESREFCEEWATKNYFPLVQKFDKTLAEVVAEDNPNEEGYVLTYGNGLKIKCKFLEYCRLHRILTGLNPKAVWEMLSLRQDGAIDALLSDEKIPASFKVWFSGWVEQLRSKHAEIEQLAQSIFKARPMGTRKEIALYFQRTPTLCSVLFSMLDEKDYGGVIWGKIRPRGDETFKKDGE